ncbi:MAG: Yip1 family protein, partial [Oscillospiraceae bacterium]
GEYEKSLDFAQKSFYWTGYSLAFKEYRDTTVANIFPFILLAAVILILAPIIFTQIKAKKYKSSEEYTIHRNKTQYLKYCLFHPFKAYGDMKYEKKGSVTYATIIILIVVVIEILSRTVVGFLYNPSVAKILYFNFAATVLSTLGGFFLWTLCNWAITTLFDGEGKFSEIWVFSAYAFMPRIVCMIPIIILSRLVTQDELQFIGIMEVLMYIWIGVSIIMAIKEVHQYSMKKTFLAIIFTIFGMVLVVCIGAIVYSMFVQLISFVSNIFNEISLRI